MATSQGAPGTLQSFIDGATSEQLAAHAATCIAVAAERRKQITVDEAWAAYNMVPDMPDWHWGGFPECGQIRKACEVLIAWHRHHPEQITTAMTEVAMDVCSHWGDATEVIAREAVAAGISDGRFALEGDGDD